MQRKYDVQADQFAVFQPSCQKILTYRQFIHLENSTQIAAYVKLQLYRDLGRWKSFVYAPLFEGFVKKTFMIVAADSFEKIFWQTLKPSLVKMFDVVMHDLVQ